MKRVNEGAESPSKPLAEEDDHALVARARKGDRLAFRGLVERHERKAYAVALGMLKNPDDARDVVQDAFLKVWKSLGAFEGQSAFYTWLYRIVANLCIDQIRKGRTQVQYDDSRVHEEDEVPEGDNILPQTAGLHPGRVAESRELGDAIARALDALSPNHRAVLLMREVEGLSYKEMAQAMGCSEGTIMSRLFHARKKMQAALIEFVQQEKREQEK
jgi:RNA polymerase sigma-70 factor (ECF subfamily)